MLPLLLVSVYDTLTIHATTPTCLDKIPFLKDQFYKMPFSYVVAVVVAVVVSALSLYPY